MSSRHRSASSLAPRALGGGLALATLPLLLVALGCDQTLPGTEVATFEVTGTLTDNECGAGFAPADEITFNVQVRRNGTLAYWRVGDGAIVDGTYNTSTDVFRFRTQVAVAGWNADVANGIPACQFTQTETVEGTIEGYDDRVDAASVDGGVDDEDADGGGSWTDSFVFRATETVRIATTSGYDCSLAEADNGGEFDDLPCEATYELVGYPAD